jgi:hypothetical protein
MKRIRRLDSRNIVWERWEKPSKNKGSQFDRKTAGWVIEGYYTSVISALKHGPQEWIKGKDAKELMKSTEKAYATCLKAFNKAVKEGKL